MGVGGGGVDWEGGLGLISRVRVVCLRTGMAAKIGKGELFNLYG